MYQQLLYTSRASANINATDVYDIIRKSNNRNSTNGLTGGLIFLDGYFIQVLEGSPYAVAQRYEKIVKDERHYEINLRLNSKREQLLFPQDWMALRTTSDIPLQTLSEFDYKPGLPADCFDGEQILEFMMRCFAKSLQEQAV